MRVSEVMRTVGQASMGVFAAQYFIYYTVFFLLVSQTHLAPLYLWPIYWLASLYLLYKFAQFWNKAGLQSFLSVGYPFQWRSKTAVLATRPWVRSLPSPPN
jgi:hypothetical protein